MKEIKIKGYCAATPTLLKEKFKWSKYPTNGNGTLFIDDLPYIFRRRTNKNLVKIEITIKIEEK